MGGAAVSRNRLQNRQAPAYFHLLQHPAGGNRHLTAASPRSPHTGLARSDVGDPWRMVRNQPAHALERPIHAHLYAAHTLPNTPFIFEVSVLILPCCQESNETRPPFTQRMLKGSDRWNGALAVPPMFQTTTRSYRWAWNFTRWPRAKVPSPCLSFVPVGTKSSHSGGTRSNRNESFTLKSVAGGDV